MPIEKEISRIGADLAGALPAPQRHPLRRLDERAMGYAAEERELRAALFRLVDVAPACRAPADLARHLASLLAEVPDAPATVRATAAVARSRTGHAAVGVAAAAAIRHMAHRFIAGESLQDALPLLGDLWKAGIASSVDLLGEAAVTHGEADAYAQRCLSTLEELATAAPAWPERALLERDGSGPIPRVNLAVKLTAMTPLMRPHAPRLGADDARTRLARLLARARELDAHLHIDMESLDTLEASLDLALDALGRSDAMGGASAVGRGAAADGGGRGAAADGPSAGIVIQAYLRDSPDTLGRVLDWAGRTRRRPLTVRLVKGAYWDHEIVQARQRGWSMPVFERKEDCDRNFERLTRALLQARPLVRVAIGSHNLRSVAHAIAWNRELGGAAEDLELQVLRGLGDDLAHALAARGLRVRAYCPIGDLVSGMAYLIRRLLENTSNEAFLTRGRRGESLQTLLAAP